MHSPPLHIRFVVPGKPSAKPRDRVAVYDKRGRLRRNSRGKVVPHSYPGKGGEQYEKHIKTFVKRAHVALRKRGLVAPGCPVFPEFVALELTLTFALPRPKSVPRRKRPAPVVVPDFDNFEKIVADAMNGIMYHDDRQVVDNHTKLRYFAVPRKEVYTGWHGWVVVELRELIAEETLDFTVEDIPRCPNVEILGQG